MGKKPRRRLIQLSDGPLNILEVLADRGEPVGLTELAKTMGRDSSTV